MVDTAVCDTFAVRGMHCASCAITIDWELEDLPGVVEANTSYVAGTTRVRFDPALVSADDIVDAISRAGFRARKVQ